MLSENADVNWESKLLGESVDLVRLPKSEQGNLAVTLVTSVNEQELGCCSRMLFNKYLGRDMRACRESATQMCFRVERAVRS